LHFKVEGSAPLCRRQEIADASSEHRSMKTDELPLPADHHRVLRPALMSEVPDQLQSTPALWINLVELIKHHGARPLIEEFADCRAGPESFWIWSKHQVPCDVRGGGFSAVRLFAGQCHPRCNRKPLIDMREDNPQREDDANMLGHRHVF